MIERMARHCLRLLVAVVLTVGAVAEAEAADVIVVAPTEQEVISATGEMAQWQGQLQQIAQTVSGENVAAMAELSDEVLMIVENIAIEIMDGVAAVKEIKGDIIPRDDEISYGSVGTGIEFGTYWMKELALYASCNVYYRDDYLFASYSLFDENGNYLGTRRVELGHRENQNMALVVDYDHISYLTGRYALLTTDDVGIVFFTKTIGRNLDIILDVDAWQRGEPLQEWSKSLLLPAML